MNRILSIIFLCISLFGCNTKFDSKKWKAHNDLDEIDNPRWHMKDDLKKILNEQSLNEQEIINLLGSPSESHEFNGEKVLYYPIGWKTGFGIDSDFLTIYLNSDGKYIKNAQEQH